MCVFRGDFSESLPIFQQKSLKKISIQKTFMEVFYL